MSALSASQDDTTQLRTALDEFTVVGGDGDGYPRPPTTTRGSDLRALLIAAERDVAEYRENLAAKDAEVATLKAALQREHENALRVSVRHQSEVEAVRAECEHQQAAMAEQLTVLKGLAESALQDKQRVNEESATRKQQLMTLLERERGEKSQILADYRQQTEALIGEQGREITGLRQLLALSRTEEEKLLGTIRQLEERNAESETRIFSLESDMQEENLSWQKRLREVEHRHAQAVDQLRARNDREEQNLRYDVQRGEAARATLEDTVRSLTEKLRAVETAHDAERRRLRDSYEGDVSALQEEMRVMKENASKAEAAYRREIEKITRNEEALVGSLKKQMEQLRAEKSSSAEEARQQRETVISEYQTRVVSLQAEMDVTRKELQEERVIRKENQMQRQVLQQNNDQLVAQVGRLELEVEQQSVERRSRERQVEQEHLSALEAVRDAQRNAEEECSELRQALKRGEMDRQRLSDALEERQMAFEQLRNDTQRTSDAHRAAVAALNMQLEEAKRQYTRTNEALQNSNVNLESEVSRLERAVRETESRLSASVKQLADERKALEVAIEDGQALKSERAELRSALDKEKRAVIDVSNELQDARRRLEGAVAQSDVLQEEVVKRSGEVERLTQDLTTLARKHESELHSVRLSSRQALADLDARAATLGEQLQASREAQSALEQQVRLQRDEAARWQRECYTKDEVHNETLRTIRLSEDDELSRMDGVINQIREDLARAQAAKLAAQREVAEASREAERRVQIVQEALEAERQAKGRLHDEVHNSEKLTAELKATTRLLNTRLQMKDEELRRSEHELQDANNRIQEAHTTIGRKDALVGQLTARLRMLEARGSP